MTASGESAVKTLQPARIPNVETEPNLSNDKIVKAVAGLRPLREGGFRIEYERIHAKHLIHNYGHGGAGVTMSWGSAAEVTRLAQRHCQGIASACVIGGGVIGLTTALRLREMGLKVRVSSELYTPRTTSDIAGAQWAPSYVEVGDSCEQRQMFERILHESFRQFKHLLGERYGISVRPNYVESNEDSAFDQIPAGILPPARLLDQLPFQSNPVAGRVYTTFMIEPPVFMPRLMQDCRDAGIELETRKFASADELYRLPDDLVVHCTGLGASKLANDRAVIALRGQLVHLEPQALPWLLSHRHGYVFPRRDAVLLGGTTERGLTDATATDEGVASILAGNRKFFGHR